MCAIVVIEWLSLTIRQNMLNIMVLQLTHMSHSRKQYAPTILSVKITYNQQCVKVMNGI